MNETRRLPTPEQVVAKARQGLIDDSILYLSDDELREELAEYRRERRPAIHSKPRAS